MPDLAIVDRALQPQRGRTSADPLPQRLALAGVVVLTPARHGFFVIATRVRARGELAQRQHQICPRAGTGTALLGLASSLTRPIPPSVAREPLKPRATWQTTSSIDIANALSDEPPKPHPPIRPAAPRRPTSRQSSAGAPRATPGRRTTRREWLSARPVQASDHRGH